MKTALSAALSILLCLQLQSSLAQSEQLQEIQRDLALFTGILEEELGPVSYTHLTLPTIYSV